MSLVMKRGSHTANLMKDVGHPVAQKQKSGRFNPLIFSKQMIH